MLSVMLSVVSVSVYAVRVGAGRAQLANAADQAAFSLFAGYDRDLLDRYGLFFIDGGYGTDRLRMDETAGRLEDSMDYILNPGRDSCEAGRNLIHLRRRTLSLTNYVLASDLSFGIYADQAVECMRETGAAEGAELLREHLLPAAEESRQMEA